MFKEIKIRKITVGSFILLVSSISIPYLNTSSPQNNPSLIPYLSDGLSVISLSLLVVCLITHILKKVFHKFPSIHIVTFFILIIVPLFFLVTTIDGAFITQRINSNSKQYPSYSVCLTCSYSNGDFIAWYDKSGNSFLGELIATEGDEVRIKDGNIFLNGVDSSYSLMSTFDKNITLDFKLNGDEYLALQGQYPRTLTKDQVSVGRINKGHIAGKVTEIISGVNTLNKTPKITVLDRLYPDEIEQYYNSYTSSEPIFLRKALNNYLNGESNEQINKLAINKHVEQNYTFGLDSFDKNYYKSKFIIIGGGDNSNGGKDLLIVFVDKPDKIFSAQVIREKIGLELRNFYSENRDLPPAPNRFTDYFDPFLKDNEHSL